MASLVRREVIETAQTVVVKIGTSVLSRDDDRLDRNRIAVLAQQVHRLRETGRAVVIVSSGAIGAGLALLEIDRRPSDLPHLQAAAATGQAQLIQLYDNELQRYGYHAAQLLLTANDFRFRSRYLNVRNTLTTLLEFGVVPIVNENDTVSVEQIKFGDNDRLAAMVTNLVPNPLLVILTVVDGLYQGVPRDGQAPIPIVSQWSDSLDDLVYNERSRGGTGGMASKLDAVRRATAVGENVIIANGRRPNVLDDIRKGHDVGTLFLAQGPVVPAWKRWIGYTVPPGGHYVCDAGATKAIRTDGRSLLAAGVRSVEGHFSAGEVVGVKDTSGTEFARGLTNYNSKDAARIAGKRSEDIREMMNQQPPNELIHRDNLALLTTKAVS